MQRVNVCIRECVYMYDVTCDITQRFSQILSFLKWPHTAPKKHVAYHIPKLADTKTGRQTHRHKQTPTKRVCDAFIDHVLLIAKWLDTLILGACERAASMPSTPSGCSCRPFSPQTRFPCSFSPGVVGDNLRACTLTHTHIHTHTRTQTHTYIYTRAHIHTHTKTYTPSTPHPHPPSPPTPHIVTNSHTYAHTLMSKENHPLPPPL